MPIVSIGQKKAVEPMMLFYRENTNNFSRKVHLKKDSTRYKEMRYHVGISGLIFSFCETLLQAF